MTISKEINSQLDREQMKQAFQIVEIDENGAKFHLHEHVLKKIFETVPGDMKVSIVSVVGAFRTGKSFVLDLFLRYLRYQSNINQTNTPHTQTNVDWIYTGVKNGLAQTKLEGNSNKQNCEDDASSKSGETETGFSWRAGRERNTTGIWMWGEYFQLKGENNEDLAVFLVDTQGMFDSDTTQMLTACIFGLSTLLSSYQIYNIDKRIQEDNLQHLALFTEYGRMALSNSGVVEDSSAGNIENGDSSDVEKSKDKTSMKPNDVDDTLNSLEECDTDKEDEAEEVIDRSNAPFQTIDFLVRDWQNFDEDSSQEDKIEEMGVYLNDILTTNKLHVNTDLAQTREQITSCFQKVSCWLLPHPGLKVTKKNYDGSVSKIDPEFIELLTVYLDGLFISSSQRLAPKKIHGKAVTASELVTFITTYANLFKEATIFPEAKTLLEATSEANNFNMRMRALDKYKYGMEKIAGLKCKYVNEDVLEKHHKESMSSSLVIFDSGATMGRRSAILTTRQDLIQLIKGEFERYLTLNKEKNPYKNIEFYLIPMTLVTGAYMIRVTQDMMCYDEFGYDIPIYDCKHVSVTLSHFYWALITFMLLVAFATGTIMMDRIKLVVNVVKNILMDHSAGTQSIDSSSKMKKD